MHSRQKGLTLIELMIAVAIIGIISALALPAWRSYVDTANVAKVNAAFENAIRVTQNVFARSRSRVAIGLPSALPKGDSHWDRISNWIELFDASGVEAPGGGPVYVDTRTTQEEADETGAVRIHYTPTSGGPLGELTVHRPAYLDLTRATATITADSLTIVRADE